MRYLIYPGPIDSESDGDVHYIGFNDLIRLHKLDPKTCVNMNDERVYVGFQPQEGDVKIFPKYHHKDYPLFRDKEGI